MRRRRKKTALSRPAKKPGAKPRGRQDAKRMGEMRRRVAQVGQALDQLGNPFDHMSIDQKKEHALFLFYRRLQVKNICTKRTQRIVFHSVSEYPQIARMFDLCASVCALVLVLCVCVGLCVCVCGCVCELINCRQSFLVQVAIEAGERFFSSRARIVASVAEEVNKTANLVLLCFHNLTIFAIPDIRLVSQSVACEDG